MGSGTRKRRKTRSSGPTFGEGAVDGGLEALTRSGKAGYAEVPAYARRARGTGVVGVPTYRHSRRQDAYRPILQGRSVSGFRGTGTHSASRAWGTPPATFIGASTREGGIPRCATATERETRPCVWTGTVFTERRAFPATQSSTAAQRTGIRVRTLPV